MSFANVGTPDRILRLVIAVILAIVPFAVASIAPSSVLGIVMFAAAAILAVTALFSFCPLYSLTGLRTRPKPGTPS